MTERISALIFKPTYGYSFVCEAGGWLSQEVEDVSNTLDDLGIPEPESTGLWVFTGVADWSAPNNLTGEGAEIIGYRGEYRRIYAHEAVRLITGARLLDQPEWEPEEPVT